MKIRRLYTENLYSYENMEFNFDKYPGGTTLFLGRNLDQKTSNASGKSTIMKSLFFMLYGEDVSGAVKAETIRRGSSNWFGELEFEDKGHTFKIERFEGRKDKNHTGKPGINFYIDNKLFKADGIEETQKIINQKLKITPRLFLSSVYSAQNSKYNFLLESDTNKKELLSELLDLLIYAKAFEHVKDEIDTIEEKIKDRENKLKINEDQIKEYDEQVKDLINKKVSFDDELNNNLLKEKEELKVIIDKMNSIESNIVLKLDLNKIKNEILETNKVILNLENELSNETKVKVMIEKIENGILSLSNEKENISKTILELKNEIVNNDISEDITSLEKIELINSQINDKLLVIDSNKVKINDLNLSLQKEQNDHQQLSKDLSSLEEKIESLKNSKCPTCLREYEESHLAHIKDELDKLNDIKESLILLISKAHEKTLLINNELNLIKNSIKDEKDLKDNFSNNQKSILDLQIKNEKAKIKKEENEKINKKISDLSSLLIEKDNRINVGKEKLKEVKKIEVEINQLKENYKNEKNKIQKLNDQLIKAELEYNRYEQGKKLINDLSSQKEKITNNIESLKNKTNPYGEMIFTIEKKIEYVFEKNAQIKDFIKKESENLKYLNFWKIGFAPTGIRSFITDDVIDLLNRKVQENLNDLFNGAISVLFDPESKNNKGVVSNKISTKFFMNGKEISKETLSGGEKRRAILATDLALTEIAESRSGNKFNIRFLDEPFDGMDSNGQLQAFKLFSRLSKDKDGFFVISHDENFQNMCSNVVYILKKNGISRIVDKDSFENSDIDSDKELFESYRQENKIVEDVDHKKQELANKLKKLVKK